MVRTTFFIAGLLVLVGVVFAFLTHSPHAASPAAVGVLLAICGVIVAAKPSLRKHVMHVAMLLAVLAILGMIFPVIKALQMHDPIMLCDVVLTMLLCVLYVVLGVRSFIAARRSADAAAAETAGGQS